MPKSRFSYSYRPTPSLPLAKLTLCFLARDWEAIFVEEELINGASYSPDRTDNRMPKPRGKKLSCNWFRESIANWSEFYILTPAL